MKLNKTIQSGAFLGLLLIIVSPLFAQGLIKGLVGNVDTVAQGIHPAVANITIVFLAVLIPTAKNR